MRLTPTLLVGTVSVFASCRAHMETPPGSVERYGPVDEASRPGVVRYLNAGARPVREHRRRNAYKQMYETCGGYYRIDSEGPESPGYTTIRVTPFGASASTEGWWAFQFTCVPPPGAYSPRRAYLPPPNPPPTGFSAPRSDPPPVGQAPPPGQPSWPPGQVPQSGQAADSPPASPPVGSPQP
jgi:hypothetical protein